MTTTPDSNVVDFWFDPVCPYSWTASRWLREVEQRRPLRVRQHVMSLYLLNEHRTDVSADYRHHVESSRGPSRVATAAVTRFGEEVLDGFYTAFGEVVFDRWRRPSSADYHVAIRQGLMKLSGALPERNPIAAKRAGGAKRGCVRGAKARLVRCSCSD